MGCGKVGKIERGLIVLANSHKALGDAPEAFFLLFHVRTQPATFEKHDYFKTNSRIIFSEMLVFEI